MRKSNKTKIEVQGHRGFRGRYPENSIIGFHKAAELGVDVLEMDICVSKDKQVVVSHEPFINPLICDLNVEPRSLKIAEASNLYNLTYEEIKKFDCGSKPHPQFPLQENINAVKPLLREVFEEIGLSFPLIGFNIEIKAHPVLDEIFTPKPVEYVRLVLDVIDTSGINNPLTLQSFDIRILEQIHLNLFSGSIALLVDENEDVITKLKQLSFKPGIISPYFTLLNSHLCGQLKDLGFRIVPWTVNEEIDLLRMIELNVDGIITDYPDRLMEILG